MSNARNSTAVLKKKSGIERRGPQISEGLEREIKNDFRGEGLRDRQATL